MTMQIFMTVALVITGVTCAVLGEALRRAYKMSAEAEATGAEEYRMLLQTGYQAGVDRMIDRLALPMNGSIYMDTVAALGFDPLYIRSQRRMDEADAFIPFA